LPEITEALKRDSHAQVIRNAALKALGNMGGIQLAGTIAPYAGFDRPRMSRAAALRALGECGRYEQDAAEAMIPLLNALRGPNPYLRGVALDALATLGAEAAIPEIASFAQTTKLERERDAARKTIEAIRSKRAQNEEIRALRDQVHALDDKNRDLEKRLDALEDLVKKLPSE
jgi:HEAT repeat protein